MHGRTTTTAGSTLWAVRPSRDRPYRARRARVVVAAAASLTLAASLAGCTHHDDDTQAQITSAANQLATALVASDLAAVPIVGSTPEDATAERKSVFAQLPAKPKITVKQVATVKDASGKKSKDDAQATLDWSWSLGGKNTWTYTTTAKLVRPTGGSKQSTAAAAWQVQWDPTLLLPGLAGGERVTVARETPQRADIVDASGDAIVKARPVHVIGIDKTQTTSAQWATSAHRLAKGLGLDADAYVAQVKASGPKAFVEAITLRTNDPTGISALTKIPGVSVIDSSLPLAPTRTWARPILGSVGDATAQIVKDSDGRIAVGQQTGLSGLEKQYDAQLAGTAGVKVSLTGGNDGTRTLYTVAVVDGKPLKLTLDSSLQTDAEKILASQTSPSAIVAMTTSGKVLAAASGTAGNGLSTATLGQYAPGSTMKIATSLALLRRGDTASSKVTCTPTLTVDGRKFSNDDGYPANALGKITLHTAFANSCNTAFMSQAPNVSQQQLHDAAASLGIGVPSALGAPAFFGDVPAKATSDTDHAASMIGQGRVEASPLTMATVAASVAAGKRVSPVLVTNPDGERAGTEPTATPSTAASTAPAAAPRKLTAAEAKTLHSLMRGVVTEGTGTILDTLPNDVAAKTGTAQYGDGSKQHAWMVAIDGDVAVCAFVEDGSYGATTAGPLLKTFLEDVNDSGANQK
jgi:cell division protein FtsI/penicillin-binding protein 2